MTSRSALIISRIYDTAESRGLLDTLGRSWPMKGSAFRIRPYILALFLTWVLILGVLGLAPLPELWINDKVLHFFGMGIATFLTYYILEVPDAARRVWYNRRAPLLLVCVINFALGDVASEILQGMLPYRSFSPLDIVFNLLGSIVFFALAHALMRHGRTRWEISRLYRPDGVGSGGIGDGRESARGYRYALVDEDEVYPNDVEGSRPRGEEGGKARPGSQPAAAGKTANRPQKREDSVNSLISLDGDPDGDIWSDRRYAKSGTATGEESTGPGGAGRMETRPVDVLGSPPDVARTEEPGVFDLGEEEEEEEEAVIREGEQHVSDRV